MYATIGYIVPEYYKFPGYLSPSLGLKFSDVPNGLAALSKRRPYQGDARDRQRMITVQDANCVFLHVECGLVLITCLGPLGLL